MSAPQSPNKHRPGPIGLERNESTSARRMSPNPGEYLEPMLSPGAQPIKPDFKKKSTIDLDEYFSGPVDPTRHSKLPYFMRLHGSILPKLVVPILFVALWATMVTCVSTFSRDISVDSVLLTVLGFVVGLSLSFRSSTAYERYAEGRKFWAQLSLHSRNVSRIIWVHTKQREDPEEAKEDLLMKLTAINLILAFAESVKHKLRHEIEYSYSDLMPLINNLKTFAKDASEYDTSASEHNRNFDPENSWAEFLGIPFYQSNPKKAVKEAAKAGLHHGNLPLEIMTHLASYIDHAINNDSLVVSVMHTQVMNSLLNMMDAYGGCERVLGTPLPLAYSIAISQITWLYVLVLPFQLFSKLKWVTIPGTIVAAYIILGIAAIGREIENPFGRDVNDLHLDSYCAALQHDLNVLTSNPPPQVSDWVKTDENKPLWPYSVSGYHSWKAKSINEIRLALSQKISHQSTTLSENNEIKSSKRYEDSKGSV